MNKHEYATLFEKRAERAEDDSFRVWLAEPTVQLLLSMIPAAQHPEVVRTLLRECFGAGMRTGLATLTLHLAETIIKPARGDQGTP